MYATVQSGDHKRQWAWRLPMGLRDATGLLALRAPLMAARHPTRQAAPQLRVLVVDDNVEGAEALCALLESMGCATAIAFDGAQGLAAADRFDPHLGFIDLEMPGMSGCDVARHLRADDARSSARLVCLTGRGQPEDRRVCMDAGFDDFFVKPMLLERLSEVVASANEGLGRR